MQVKELMSRDFLTVDEDDGGVGVGDKLERRNISAAIVLKRDTVLGLVSKETFFSKIDTFCTKPLEAFKVRDLMEYDVDFVNEDDDISVAGVKLLDSKSTVDRLPVLSDGKLTGIISKIEFTQLFANTMGRKYKVKDLMGFNPVTVADYTPMTKVVEEMLSSDIKRILVLSGNRLVGIIAVKDISLSLFLEKKMCKSFNPVSILTASELMTRNLITVTPKMDAAEAAKIMIDKKVGGLPVMNPNLEGILTRGCLMKGFQIMWE